MWKNINDPHRFKDTDTGNSAYAFLPITTFKNTDHKLFMKVTSLIKLSDGSAVNPLIDNLNGIIINEISKMHPQIASHTMRYLTSFTTLVQKNGDTIMGWPWKNITNVDSTWCPFSASKIPQRMPPADIYATSIFDSVEGRSIHDMLRSNENSIFHVLWALPEFCESLQLLGMKYGMMHNDLHTENVFIDGNTMKLVLIDYGMMTFSNAPLPLEKYVHDEKQRNYMYFTTATYSKLVEKHQTALKYRSTDPYYFTHVFDFATLMANIEYEARATMENDGDSWDWFDGYFMVRPALIDRMGSHIMIPSRYETIQAEYLKAVERIKKDITLDEKVKKGLLVVAEGVFFMSWILLHIHTAVRKQNVSSSSVKIELDDLAIDELVYYYFQMYDLTKINPHKLCESFATVSQNVVQSSSILQKLRGNKLMEGGKKKRKQKAGMINENIELRSNANAGENFLDAMIKTEKRRVPPQQRNAQLQRPMYMTTEKVAHAPTVAALAGGKKKQKKT